MRTVLLTLLTLLFACSVGGLARADASPFPGPPETCTETKKEQPGTDCRQCTEDYDVDDDSAGDCADEFVDSGYVYVCSSRGWPSHEIWCDGPPREGCSLAASGAPSASVIGVFCGLSALGIVVLTRRRR
jgi:hypothetical protein